MGNQPLMQTSVEVVKTFEQVAHDGSFWCGVRPGLLLVRNSGAEWISKRKDVEQEVAQRTDIQPRCLTLCWRSYARVMRQPSGSGEGLR